mgnify:CR=1 FL=1
MRIDGIGIGTYPNRIRVRREWLGTVLAGHSTGALVTKVNGNYNIVENVLNFAEAPYGNIPLSSTTNHPDDRDWVGISTGSSFQGRVFMRSGITNSSNETYYKNLIFDDISAGFNGTTKSFDLKSNGSNVTGIATENGVILVNDVFQGPVVNYDLNEKAGVTSITFTGAATSIASDINTSTLPIGGVVALVLEFFLPLLEELDAVVVINGDAGAEDADQREASMLNGLLHQHRQMLRVGAECSGDESCTVHDG